MSRYFTLIIGLLLIGCHSDNKQNASSRVGTEAKKKQISVVDARPIDIGNKETKAASSNSKAVSTNPKGIDPNEKTKLDQTTVKSQDPKPQISKTVPKKKTKPKVKPRPKPQPKPQILFEHMRHDFDTLMQGDKYNFNFNFKNTGNADLEITKAKGSCGCTQPSFPFIGIPPGETGFIGVEYNSVGKALDQSATIEVFTNIQESPFVLHLTGHVKEPEKEESEEQEIKEMVKDSIK